VFHLYDEMCTLVLMCCNTIFVLSVVMVSLETTSSWNVYLLNISNSLLLQHGIRALGLR
jgi:hypothetical protein